MTMPTPQGLPPCLSTVSQFRKRAAEHRGVLLRFALSIPAQNGRDLTSAFPFNDLSAAVRSIGRFNSRKYPDGVLRRMRTPTAILIFCHVIVLVNEATNANFTVVGVTSE